MGLRVRSFGVLFASAVLLAGCADYFTTPWQSGGDAPHTPQTPNPQNNQAPIASIADPGTGLLADADVQLDATGSYDPDLDGAVTSVLWTVISQPNGHTTSDLIYPEERTRLQPRLWLEHPGVYVVELIVTDNKGRQSAPATINVTSNPWIGVSARWDNQPQADLDIHLVDMSNNGVLFDMAFDCFWNNCANADTPLDWGVPGPAGDPFLIRDQPTPDEYATVVAPTDGVRYRVVIHKFNNPPPPRAEVEIVLTVNGYDEVVLNRRMNEQFETHVPVEIEWPSQNITTPALDGHCNPNDLFTCL